MVKVKDSNKARLIRHKRVRGKISGTPEFPRLNVFRSNKHIVAQIKDVGTTSGNCEEANKVGKLVAERAVKAGIKDVVFDRGGYVYHGRVKALAEGAREGGLQF